jgi:hypothetical protein
MSHMSNTSRTSSTPVWGVDPAVVAAAIERGRRERSQAFWAMLQAVFGRPENRDAADSAATRRPNIAGVR